MAPYSVQGTSTKYNVQSTKYNVQSTKYNVQSTRYNVQDTMYKYKIQCTKWRGVVKVTCQVLQITLATLSSPLSHLLAADSQSGGLSEIVVHSLLLLYTTIQSSTAFFVARQQLVKSSKTSILGAHAVDL